ncbi:sugar ABC transporter ATP-binding protein [Aeribacillus composti]|jgi:ABC-type sugar transport system ATPase subunit|uniref:sugar ABC transporter ATP-binding protein n=1 Tax=Aeribacillus TaxID=1055323 RepID=UPI002E22A5ED|nr:sugar ABC transporter ATP-binding protein [Aeribacillus composti]MED0744958.1 sugar ABC transporter ATP-binding protein [Aeribacillus composti]
MIKTLQLRNISKEFQGVKALSNVSLTIHGGQIHCLVGENGAGKSTMIKILAGFYKPDQGEILIDGKKVTFSSPKDSKDHGIAVIHQELLLVPHLSVAENISLGHWPKSSQKMIDWKGMNKRANDALNMLGANINPEAKVSSLSTGEQQLVEIARSLSMETKVLILDEPTASLSESEAQRLMQIVKNLRDKGLVILYVSHRLEEVFELADMITVFRDGKLVSSVTKDEITPDELVRLMVGRNVSLKRTRKAQIGKKILEVRNLKRIGAVENVSFDLHEGEILGLGGLVGSGRTEIFRCLFGIDRIDEGEIMIDGKPVKIKSTVDAIKHGIALVPEDRKTQGLVLSGSVKENVSLSILNRIMKYGWIDQKRENEIVQSYKEQFRIKTPNLETSVISLSGGNQQKIVLSRWLATNPKILLLDEPTRGVDVGARSEIQNIIEKLVSEGLAIILISSDIMELLALSDRVIVIKEGRNVAELKGDMITKEEVLKYATGADAG